MAEAIAAELYVCEASRARRTGAGTRDSRAGVKVEYSHNEVREQKNPLPTRPLSLGLGTSRAVHSVLLLGVALPQPVEEGALASTAPQTEPSTRLEIFMSRDSLLVPSPVAAPRFVSNSRALLLDTSKL
jgi:hypothetical protein